MFRRDVTQQRPLSHERSISWRVRTSARPRRGEVLSCKTDTALSHWWVAFGPDQALYLVSERDTPRRRILKLAPGDFELAHARTLVPPNADVIDTAFFGEDPIVFVGRTMAVRYLTGGPSRLRLFDLEGRARGEAALPPIASVAEMEAVEGDLVYSIETYLTPRTFHRRTGAAIVMGYARWRARFPPAGYTSVTHDAQRAAIGERTARILATFRRGGMAEWSMAVVLKTTVPERVPGVRCPVHWRPGLLRACSVGAAPFFPVLDLPLDRHSLHSPLNCHVWTRTG